MGKKGVTGGNLKETLWKLNLVKGNTNIQPVNQLRMLWRAPGLRTHSGENARQNARIYARKYARTDARKNARKNVTIYGRTNAK